MGLLSKLSKKGNSHPHIVKNELSEIYQSDNIKSDVKQLIKILHDESDGNDKIWSSTYGKLKIISDKRPLFESEHYDVVAAIAEHAIFFQVRYFNRPFYKGKYKSEIKKIISDLLNLEPFSSGELPLLENLCTDDFMEIIKNNYYDRK